MWPEEMRSINDEEIFGCHCTNASEWGLAATRRLRTSAPKISEFEAHANNRVRRSLKIGLRGYV